MNIIRKIANKFGIEIQRMNHSDDVDHYIRLYGTKSVQQKRFYNVGAGNFFHPCWTNIDNGSDLPVSGIRKAALINYDLFSLLPMPLPSDVAKLIYTSHTIEHITDIEVQHLFNEAFRTLETNGIFRIVTPDIDNEYRAWRNNDRDYWNWINDDYNNNPESYKKRNLNIPLREASNSQLFLCGFASTASIIHTEGSSEKITDDELEKIFREMPYTDALNYCLSRCSVEVQKKFPFDHINWFNKEKLFRMLRKAGFEKIHVSAYGQSLAPVMRNLRYFDSTLPNISIYVEAVK